MVRCEQCGYQNQDGIQKCVKCRTPLVAREPVAATKAESSASQKTLTDYKFDRQPWDGKDETKDIGIKETQPTTMPATDKKTADIYRTVFVSASKPKLKTCALIALSEDRTQNLRTIPVKGEEASLNRDLLDAGNTTISRNGHAKVTFKDGSWWLENLSSVKTTYVQVNRPVKLENGDEIIIGDSLFRFTEES